MSRRPRLSGPKFFAGGSASSSSKSPSPINSMSGERGSSETSTKANDSSSSFRPGYRPFSKNGDKLDGREEGKDTPFNASDSLQNYREQQEAGMRLLQWINIPSAPCPISLSRCNFPGLLSSKWELLEQPADLPTNYTTHATFLPPGIPGAKGSPPRKTPYRWTSMVKSLPNQPYMVSWWTGRTAEGVVFLEDVNRPKGSQYPFISEITKAVYEKDYNIETLRYVFVADVANAVTRGFIIGVLWPSTDEYPRIMESNTPEFQILLGTPIGKIVAHLVLNSFARGTRRIARVVLWPDANFSPQLRFDIERIG
ncbi:uncharacterized protein N7473_007986 [Penicillium subrubescens]|uniref:uncharacterized protein n=1 Tax=Penicillium subrubescens TaxID=1316194 RepID=UPI0025456D82|nr:uncharacterized protein N7473_007986 [Penicillium subrubescens]KAJ5891758.1 hypothetical protein N7473_007986 [Penicillium subrubescens]